MKLFKPETMTSLNNLGLSIVESLNTENKAYTAVMREIKRQFPYLKDDASKITDIVFEIIKHVLIIEAAEGVIGCKFGVVKRKGDLSDNLYKYIISDLNTVEYRDLESELKVIYQILRHFKIYKSSDPEDEYVLEWKVKKIHETFFKDK